MSDMKKLIALFESEGGGNKFEEYKRGLVDAAKAMGINSTDPIWMMSCYWANIEGDLGMRDAAEQIMAGTPPMSDPEYFCACFEDQSSGFDELDHEGTFYEYVINNGIKS